MTTFRPLTQPEMVDIYDMLKMADKEVRGNSEPLFTAIEAMEEAILPEPGDEAATPAPFELPTDFGGSQRMILADRLYIASLDAPESFEGCEPQTVFNLPGSEQVAWLRVADEAIAALVEVPSA